MYASSEKKLLRKNFVDNMFNKNNLWSYMDRCDFGRQITFKWDKKYEKVLESWRNNWAKLTTYFRYDDAIRKLIYTTNTIEGYQRQIRKVTKTKGAFTSDMALLKLIYLAHNNIKQKWTMPLANWGQTAQKLAIWFPERMKLDLN